MRVSASMLGFAIAASLTLSPAFADAHGAGPGAKPVKASKPNVSKPLTSGKPVASGKPTSSSAMRATGKPAAAPKPTKVTSNKPLTSSVKPVKSTTPKATTAHAKKTATPTTTLSPVGSPTPLNPIAAKIASKPNLNAKITGLLPIDPLTGRTMTLDKASLGFKNQGQFIAALHVSQNLGIPFTELKSHMVTVTPGLPGELPTATQTGSLGRAIQASKANVNTIGEIERAELQVRADLSVTTQTTTTTSTVQTTKKNPTMPRGVR